MNCRMPGLPVHHQLRVHSDSRPSSHWCHPAISSSVVALLLLPPIPSSIRVFSKESTLHMRWPKYWSFSFSISPSKEHPGLIFRMAMLPSNPTIGHTHQGYQNWKRPMYSSVHHSTVYNSQMSIGKWMDKDFVVHIHNGILFTYKKECIWVSSNQVDEPGAYYTEWSKSERERKILYINAHIGS